MRKYSWKHGSYNQVDPQLVGEELETIEEKGELTHLKVLEYAKENKNSALHQCFEWDDTVAGELYRRHQASVIVNSISYIVCEDTPKKEKQKVYVSIVNKDKERVYKNFERVLHNDDEYEQILQRAKNELERIKTDYNKLLKREDLKELFFNMYNKV